MTLRHFYRVVPKLLLLILICTIPFAGTWAKEELIREKRIKVAMRMIGHEVLMKLGDGSSRVLPIEKEDTHYRISFEFEFGFDPDDIISIVDSVMRKAEVASAYLVEVEQCDTKDVVHSFEVRYTDMEHLLPCKGRDLPKDCYSLLFTLIEGPVWPTRELLMDSSFVSIASSEQSPISSTTISSSPLDAKGSTFAFAIYLLPALIIMGFVGYFIQKKKPIHKDPNLIEIGASQFDPRNMTLVVGDNIVELSGKEADLLALLLASVNEAVSREEMLNKVWGDEGHYVGRTLDVFISKLRKKLDADETVKIVNIRGVGYKLVA